MYQVAKNPGAKDTVFRCCTACIVLVCCFCRPNLQAETRFDVVLANGSTFQATLQSSSLGFRIGDKALEVAVEQTDEIHVGLQHRPEFVEQTRLLINQLGADRFQTREIASRHLSSMGPDVRPILEMHLHSKDAERRMRANSLLQFLNQCHPDDPRYWQDHIRIGDSTQTGELKLDHVSLGLDYGNLRIPLSQVTSLTRTGRSKKLDLVAAADVKKGAVRGKWEIADGTLVTPPDTPWAMLQLGVDPPLRYSIYAEIERRSGSDAIVFPIIVGKQECNICIDGWPRNGVYHTGLELIRKQGPVSNSTGHRGSLLKQDVPTAIQIEVTSKSVRLVVDNKEIFDWKGDPEVFSMQPGWNRPNTNVLGLGCYNARFHVNKMELVPTPPNPPPILKAVNAVVLYLENQDRLALETSGQAVVFSTRGGEKTLSLNQIASFEQSDDQTTVRMKDGKQLKGMFAEKLLRFQTKYGSLEIGTNKIKSGRSLE